MTDLELDGAKKAERLHTGLRAASAGCLVMHQGLNSDLAGVRAIAREQSGAECEGRCGQAQSDKTPPRFCGAGLMDPIWSIFRAALLHGLG